MKRRLTMFLACFFLILGEVLAQTKVTGTVVAAEDGEPVIGASVIVQGQRSGTVTDADGRFTISVPSGKKITISFHLARKSLSVSLVWNRKPLRPRTVCALCCRTVRLWTRW